MKRDGRRQAIMDILIESRAVDLEDLAARFNVSKMTIHRDLDELEQAGLLRKVRGGATIETGTKFESDFRIREMQDADAKTRMARVALDLVEQGMTVMLNDGSMAAVLGGLLPQKAPLTVITNNAAVVDRLKNEPRVTLIALGGEFSAKFNGFFGVVTERALSQLRADLAFISTPAVAGAQAFHMDEAAVRAKRAMIEAAQRSVLLVNHHRFGHPALHLLADLAEFDAIITDSAPPADILDVLAESGQKLTIARDLT